MTQQEQQLLDGLIQRVNTTQLTSKDADAERFLINALGPNPDALYILCQTVLVQQFAMENSQHELATLRTQLQQAVPAKSEEHTSFLGNLFGLKKDVPPAPIAVASSGYQPVHDPGPQYPQQGGYPPPPAYPQQAYPQQGYPQYGGQPGYPPPPAYGGYAPPMGGGVFGGGGGFLAGAARTAAGVVAGEMAFRALEDVFSSGHGGMGGFGGSREIVNNNYYDDNSGSRESGGSSFGDRLGSADGLDSNTVSPDIDDRRGDDARGFFGSDGNDSANFADDSSTDDSSSYDSGSDDGGSGSDDSSF